ncbi:MAG: PucR family transcriptional regulator [Streptosporangiales bacterium]
MRLRELLAAPDLRLRALAGTDRLDRDVRAVFTTDLLDPRRYLGGGELVLTGLVWRRGPADSERFVEALAECGVAAVGAGDAALGTVPDDLVAACERRGLPLLEIPLDVSFAAVDARVAGRLRGERESRLADTLGMHRRLVAALAEGHGLRALVDLFATETGVTVRVLTCSGRQVAGTRPLPASTVDLLCHAFLTSARLPAVVTTGDGDSYSVLGAGASHAPRVSRWFLACTGDADGWPEQTRESLGGLATVAVLERQRGEEGARLRGLLAGQLLDPASTGATPVSAHGRLRDIGMDPAGRLAVATATVPSGDPAIAELVLGDLAGPESAVTRTGDQALALVPADDNAELVATWRRGVRRLSAAAAGEHIAIGLSAATTADALRGAVAEARFARGLAALDASAPALVTSAEVDSHTMLLATVPEDARRAFADRVLGPVVGYDANHDAGLMVTLDAFLAASGSWSRCAERLHLHVNTVRYRIRRVEELTGRDMSDMNDRVDVLLALRATRDLGECHGA